MAVHTKHIYAEAEQGLAGALGNGGRACWFWGSGHPAGHVHYYGLGCPTGGSHPRYEGTGGMGRDAQRVIGPMLLKRWPTGRLR